MKIYADRKYSVSGTNSAIGYAFLATVNSPSYQTQALSKLGNFRGRQSNQFKDFASTGRNIANAAYYLAIPDSLKVRVALEGAQTGRPLNNGAIRVQPNPFYLGTKLMVNIHVPELNSQTVTLKIFDIKGKLIEKMDLDNQSLKTGIMWRPDHRAPGVYLVQMNALGKTYRTKLTLLD